MSGGAKKRLGELLLEAGVIDTAQLQAALGHQRQWGVRLGQALVELKLAAEPEIVQALATKFGFDVARLDALEGSALDAARKLVPREFAVRNNVLPMAADTASVTVAMSDPTNLAVVDELRFRTGRRVKVCIGGDREIAARVRSAYPDASAAGDVEAIALDFDADDVGDAVVDPFGGGSEDALEAFFGQASAAVAPPAAAPAVPAPPAPARAAPPAQRAPSPAVAAPDRAPAPAAVPAPARTAAPGPAPARAPAAGPAPARAPVPVAAAPRAPAPPAEL
jgi:hypothetical protein